MPDSILVTYATRYGSTEEVAKSIAGVLREHALEVDVLPMRVVDSLQPYRAVIMGAPLYIGHWHNDTQNFLARHHDALLRREVAIFTLGPVSNDEAEWAGVREQVDQQLAKVAWLEPVATALFGGKYDPTHLNFMDGLLAKIPASPLHDLPPSDVRNWAEIRAWATQLLAHLQVKVMP